MDDMAGRESDVDISKSRDGRKTWGAGERAGGGDIYEGVRNKRTHMAQAVILLLNDRFSAAV